jgi:hypothetical protein
MLCSENDFDIVAKIVFLLVLSACCLLALQNLTLPSCLSYNLILYNKLVNLYFCKLKNNCFN